MNSRSPFFLYLIVWLSGGLFMLLWPFVLIREAKRLWPNSIENHKRLEVVFAALFVTYIGLLILVFFTFPHAHRTYVVPMLVIAPMLFALPAQRVAKLARILRENQVPSLSPSAAVLLFFVYGASLPLLQSRINASGEPYVAA